MALMFFGVDSMVFSAQARADWFSNIISNYTVEGSDALQGKKPADTSTSILTSTTTAVNVMVNNLNTAISNVNKVMPKSSDNAATVAKDLLQASTIIQSAIDAQQSAFASMVNAQRVVFDISLRLNSDLLAQWLTTNKKAVDLDITLVNLVKKYNTVILSGNSLDVYDTQLNYLITTTFISPVRKAITLYNNSPKTSGDIAALVQTLDIYNTMLGLLQGYNSMTISIDNCSGGLYDCTRADIAKNLLPVAQGAVAAYNSNALSINGAMALVSLLQAYNLPPTGSSAGVYDTLVNTLMGYLQTKASTGQVTNVISQPAGDNDHFGTMVVVNGQSVFVSEAIANDKWVANSLIGRIYEFKQNASNQWAIANQINITSPASYTNWNGVARFSIGFAVNADTLAYYVKNSWGDYAYLYIYGRQNDGTWAQKSAINLFNTISLPNFKWTVVINSVNISVSPNTVVASLSILNRMLLANGSSSSDPFGLGNYVPPPVLPVTNYGNSYANKNLLFNQNYKYETLIFDHAYYYNGTGSLKNGHFPTIVGNSINDEWYLSNDYKSNVSFDSQDYSIAYFGIPAVSADGDYVAIGNPHLQPPNDGSVVLLQAQHTVSNVTYNKNKCEKFFTNWNPVSNVPQATVTGGLEGNFSNNILGSNKYNGNTVAYVKQAGFGYSVSMYQDPQPQPWISATIAAWNKAGQFVTLPLVGHKLSMAIGSPQENNNMGAVYLWTMNRTVDPKNSNNFLTGVGMGQLNLLAALTNAGNWVSLKNKTLMVSGNGQSQSSSTVYGSRVYYYQLDDNNGLSLWNVFDSLTGSVNGRSISNAVDTLSGSLSWNGINTWTESPQASFSTDGSSLGFDEGIAPSYSKFQLRVVAPSVAKTQK